MNPKFYNEFMIVFRERINPIIFWNFNKNNFNNFSTDAAVGKLTVIILGKK